MNPFRLVQLPVKGNAGRRNEYSSELSSRLRRLALQLCRCRDHVSHLHVDAHVAAHLPASSTDGPFPTPSSLRGRQPGARSDGRASHAAPIAASANGKERRQAPFLCASAAQTATASRRTGYYLQYLHHSVISDNHGIPILGSTKALGPLRHSSCCDSGSIELAVFCGWQRRSDAHKG